MDLSPEAIQKILSRYKFRDVAIEELQKVHQIHPAMKPVAGTYTFSDGTQKDLLKLIGNIPVKYEGRSYNLPILLWLMDSFPFTPPICLLRPTTNMVIREGKHVDARGRIYLPSLHNWDHPKSSVVGLLAEMISQFEEEPPLGTKSTGDNRDPNELLAYVSNLKINEGGVQHHDHLINKVTVIGGGDLGMASVMSILAKGKVDRLVFIDVAESSTKGGSMDLEIFNLPKVEVSKDLSASADSSVIVVTANAWSNEQSYVSVVQTNVDMYRGIIPGLVRLSPNAVLLIASQPVDIMTHVAWRQSGLPPSRVIGAGCNLDSERLCHVLDISLNTHKQAWVIGELSDNKVPVLSNILMGASHQHPEIAPRSKATKPLLDRAFEMLKGRGQRSWSVGLSIADISHSILVDQRKTHSVSTLAQGWGGIGAEVFLSLPCLLGVSGSTRLAGVSLGQEEDARLRESVTSLCALLSQLRI
ncbi:ubiquitin-conjugating enzyme E2 variant 3 isoform X1 [Salmo trutta]|uniref:UEV and lactate/malate dehyrogenase domains n=1 Tax=Salmo trutta TaxID=8032 RepID=A0A674DPI4_SALTR|nr:ubiquitin-conjugating enzyme E2 variant 3 isoform X1 [Salmo trutta]